MIKGPDFVCTQDYLAILHHCGHNSVYRQEFKALNPEEVVAKMQELISHCVEESDEIPDYIEVFAHSPAKYGHTESKGIWRWRYGMWIKDGPQPPRYGPLLNWMANKFYGWSKALYYRANVCICPPMCHDECCNICVRNPYR